MKCQNCGKNEATFYYKSNINGRVMESHLCPECARQLGLVQDMRRPMMSSFWDDDDFFTRPFRMLEPLLGGFGSRLLTEFPEPVDVTQQARRAAEEPREDNLVQSQAVERNVAQTLLWAVSDNSLRSVPKDRRDDLRASIFKQVLIHLV